MRESSATGAYVPRYRITPTEIGRVWGTDGAAMGVGLAVERKSVPAPDEDTITISTEALRTALIRGAIDPQEIGALYVGSESHPYAVKPSATVVAQAVGATPNLTAADFEFACKAGTAAIQTCLGLVGAEMIRYRRRDRVRHDRRGPPATRSSTPRAPAALRSSSDGNGSSPGSGTPCRTRPTHRISGGERGNGIRATGDGSPASPRTSGTSRSVRDGSWTRAGTTPKSYAHVVFHQPNGKFPQRVGKQLGFSDAQMRHGLVTPYIGNTYSGAALIGLANVLDVAKPGDLVLMVGYGSGAGSDAFDLEVTDEIATFDRSFGTPVQEFLDGGRRDPVRRLREVPREDPTWAGRRRCGTSRSSASARPGSASSGTARSARSGSRPASKRSSMRSSPRRTSARSTSATWRAARSSTRNTSRP